MPPALPHLLLDTVPRALGRAGLATLLQLAVVLGPPVALGLLMHALAGATERAAERLLGRRGYLYLFGWFGTAVHELSHAAACVLFRHRVTEVVLFDPAGRGALGYVRHSYDDRSVYQRIGNFFIGVAPIVGGTLVIWLATRLLLGAGIFGAMPPLHVAGSASMGDLLSTLLGGARATLEALLAWDSASAWRVALLAAVTFAVGSSIRLSVEDLTGARGGLLVLVAALFVANVLAAAVAPMLPSLGAHVPGAQRAAARALGVAHGVMVVALLLNALAAALVLALPALLRRARR